MYSSLPLWSYVLFCCFFIHATVVSVSIYLHRFQSHRSIEGVHPVLCHALRFWIFLTTGLITKEWVAIHRKHHAMTDKSGDPHSPKLFGLARVFWLGAFLYRAEAKNQLTLEKYGVGTPSDWLERVLYTPCSMTGPFLLLVLDGAFFGFPGFAMWILQMLAIPVLAAGVINGFGHAWGYRLHDTPDTSRNIFPIAIIAGGEELHNNHHACPWSAKFSVRPWEFDIAWYYIRMFERLGWIQKVKNSRVAYHRAA